MITIRRAILVIALANVSGQTANGAAREPSRMKTHCTLVALLLTSCSLLQAANWPQFRGPDGNATSNDAKVPLKWSATENMKWKAPLPGAGRPIRSSRG